MKTYGVYHVVSEGIHAFVRLHMQFLSPGKRPLKGKMSILGDTSEAEWRRQGVDFPLAASSC